MLWQITLAIPTNRLDMNSEALETEIQQKKKDLNSAIVRNDVAAALSIQDEYFRLIDKRAEMKKEEG